MPPAVGPVLFAYDGSALAKAAIEDARGLLANSREAVVVTVWEPLDVNTFFPAESATPPATLAIRTWARP